MLPALPFALTVYCDTPVSLSLLAGFGRAQPSQPRSAGPDLRLTAARVVPSGYEVRVLLLDSHCRMLWPSNPSC